MHPSAILLSSFILFSPYSFIVFSPYFFPVLTLLSSFFYPCFNMSGKYNGSPGSTRSTLPPSAEGPQHSRGFPNSLVFKRFTGQVDAFRVAHKALFCSMGRRLPPPTTSSSISLQASRRNFHIACRLIDSHERLRTILENLNWLMKSRRNLGGRVAKAVC